MMNTSGNVSQRKSSNQNIQVYVRVRPLNAREHSIRSSEVIEVVSPREIVTRHTFESKLTKKFTFDRTFGQDSRQVEVYHTVVAPLIEEVLSGYNCTVFAYGQTGTGKTHTMIGTEVAELKSSWEDDSDIGIIPRALCHLFDELRMMKLEFSMRISYLELYNEELCDLLSSDDSVKIRIFDDSTKKGSVIIQGLEEIPVHSKDDVYKLLEKGKDRRKTATTLMNAQSSRSHTVFSILVHIRENGIDGEEMLKIGKLNLVDLAGSENVSKAGNEKGIRVRETVNINQSLLTLGRVITALVERTPHIPYRESKLTRLLQESLGGRTKTSIIATISPGHKDIEETLSTLEYAHRAKNIQNKPEINQKLTKKTVLKEYTEEIDKLKRDLMAARDKNGIYLAEETYSEMTLKMDAQHRELNEKVLLLKALKDELQNKERIFNEVSLNLVEKTEELQRATKHLTQTQGALQQTKKMLTTTKRRYKEKKVVLESHVKTEQELTNQATQILEVADLATKDTHQLHNTIARRMDVDQKIQTACEKFAERMNDNFELMDENVNNLMEQRQSYNEMIMEEFSNCLEMQSKMLNEANVRITTVNEIFDSSLKSTSEMGERYCKMFKVLGSDHCDTVKELLQEIRQKELAMKTQIEASLSELCNSRLKQREMIDSMRESIANILQSNTTDTEEHCTNMKNFLKDMGSLLLSNLSDMQCIHKEIQSERDMAQEEQSAIKTFVDKINDIQSRRTVCTETLSFLISNVEEDHQQSVAEVQKNSDNVDIFFKKRRAMNAAANENLNGHLAKVSQSIDCNSIKCKDVGNQLNELCHTTNEEITQCLATEGTHCVQLEQAIGCYETEVKRVRLQDSEKCHNACAAIKTSLSESNERLKGNIAVSSGFATSLQNKVLDYVDIYQKQINTCKTDVEKFKQSEIKTYAPTGTTPSKRDYSYPRVLAATSPHNQIIRRVRQENDWSDMDTTTTIDEDSESEEHSSDAQEVSATETIFNSTPIETSGRRSKNESTNSNSSQPNSRNNTAQHLRISNSMMCTNATTPHKAPKRQNRSDQVLNNKENIS